MGAENKSVVPKGWGWREVGYKGHPEGIYGMMGLFHMLIVVVLAQLYGFVTSHGIEHPSKILLHVKFKSRENEEIAQVPTKGNVCVCVCVLVAQLCPTLCNPMDCSLPGSSVHGIPQARIPEWVAISYSRGSSPPRDQTWVSYIAGRFFTIWVTREAQCLYNNVKILTVLHSILKIG